MDCVCVLLDFPERVGVCAFQDRRLTLSYLARSHRPEGLNARWFESPWLQLSAEAF